MTLTLLSTALNINPLSAQEVIHQFSGENDNHIATERALFTHSLVLSEIQDEGLRREILAKLEKLVSLSHAVKTNELADKSEELENAVIGMKERVLDLEFREPTISSQVKSKLLSEMLRSGVVVIDEEETLNQSRIQVVLNDSIISQLENRPGLVNSVSAAGGTVCI